jgi:hypothetical protein
MIRRLTMLAVVLALSSFVPSAALAHPGHDHKVMGTITAIDGQHVTVKTTDGKELTFAVTPTTKLVRGKVRGSLNELQAGMRVVANVGNGQEPLTAKEVQYAVTSGTTKKSS